MIVWQHFREASGHWTDLCWNLKPTPFLQTVFSKHWGWGWNEIFTCTCSWGPDGWAPILSHKAWTQDLHLVVVVLHGGVFRKSESILPPTENGTWQNFLTSCQWNCWPSLIISQKIELDGPWVALRTNDYYRHWKTLRGKLTPWGKRTMQISLKKSWDASWQNSISPNIEKCKIFRKSPLQHAVKRDFCPFQAGSSNKRSQAYRVAQVGHICPTKETSCQSKTGASAPKLTLKSQRTWLKNTSFYTHVFLRICPIFLRLSLPKVRQNHTSQMY